MKALSKNDSPSLSGIRTKLKFGPRGAAKFIIIKKKSTDNVKMSKTYTRKEKRMRYFTLLFKLFVQRKYILKTYIVPFIHFRIHGK